MKHNVSHDPGLSPQRSGGKRTLRRALVRHWPLLWLVTAALALGVCGSLAAYTNHTSTKSVVSTQVPSDLQFSSNYMSAYAMPATPTDVACDTRPLSVSAGSPSVTISVCNYDQATADTPNTNNITYTFAAVLVDKSGAPLSADLLATVSSKFSLKVLGSNDDPLLPFDATSGSVTVTGQFLAGDILSCNLYRLYPATEYLDSVSVKIYAYPEDTSSSAATNNFMLARILDLSVSSAQANTRWEISCTDSAASPTLLDGFNYELSGQLSGTLTLTWQTQHVTISPWSLEALGADASSDSDGSTASVTFTVSADTPLYLLQFYRTAPAVADESWEAVNDYVTVDFVQSDASGASSETSASG